MKSSVCQVQLLFRGKILETMIDFSLIQMQRVPSFVQFRAAVILKCNLPAQSDVLSFPALMPLSGSYFFSSAFEGILLMKLYLSFLVIYLHILNRFNNACSVFARGLCRSQSTQLPTRPLWFLYLTGDQMWILTLDFAWWISSYIFCCK